MIKNELFLPPFIVDHDLIGVSSNNNDEKRNTNNIFEENIFLFDWSVSENGLLYNADILGIDFKSINTIILNKDILIILLPF